MPGEKAEDFLNGIPNSAGLGKIPTDILVTVQGMKLVACGANAKRLYQQDEEKKYALFERFKMQLFTKNQLLTKTPMVESVCRKYKLEATKVFGLLFEYFRDCCKEILSKAPRKYDIFNEIIWVITVPGSKLIFY